MLVFNILIHTNLIVTLVAELNIDKSTKLMLSRRPKKSDVKNINDFIHLPLGIWMQVFVSILCIRSFQTCKMMLAARL